MEAEFPGETFYMTCSERARLGDVIGEENYPVMQNAVEFHNGSDYRDYNAFTTDRRVIDSGGYTAMDRYGGEFPWTVGDYHDWLRDTYAAVGFDWAAVMDFACEPDFDDDLTVVERQDRTLENTIRHLDLEPEYPLLPVLQGRTIRQWVEFYDRLQDHGVDCSYVGVGTLCRVSSENKISEIETALRTQTDIDHLHGFGTKISSFSRGAYFDTADSQAWSWQLMFGNKYRLRSEHPPELETVAYGGSDEAEAAKIQSFKAYQKRARWLQKEARRDTEQLGVWDAVDRLG